MEQQPTQPKNRRRPLVIVGIAVGALVGLCLCLAVFGALAPDRDKETAEAPAATQPAQRGQEVAVATQAAASTDTPKSTNTPESTSTPAPTPTPVPTATPKPVEAGTSRSNPLPLGKEFRGETWSITLSDVIRGQDAVQAIANANQFNEPPKPGFEYLIANIMLKNVSDKQDAQSVDFGVDLRVTGDKNVVYSRASVVPPKQLEGELFAGGAAEGQIVFEVPIDEKNLMFIVDEMMSFDSDARRFLAIDQDAWIVPDPSLREIKPTELGSRRDNPAKIGDILIAGPWEFQVVEAVRGDKAAELAKNANMFNEPAPEGQEYIAVKLKARYLGNDEPDRRDNIDGSYLKITGENNVVYESPMIVAPEPALDAYLYAGGETEGWRVLSASKGEKGLMVIFEPPLSFSSDDTRYVSLE